MALEIRVCGHRMGILVLPSCSGLCSRRFRGFRSPAAAEECNPLSASSSGRTWFPRLRSQRKRMRLVLAFSQGNQDMNAEEEEEEDDEEEGGGMGGEENNDEEDKRKEDEAMEMKELVLQAERLQKEAADKDRIQQELAVRAKEQAEKRRTAEKMFKLGQQAYGKGVYDKSVMFLETALENVSKRSNLGGDVQIWLAMAYEANNQHEACISLYKRLEASHPSKFIQRQAANLRYITEAPKLKISSDEQVTIPLINAYSESSQKTWSQMVRERKQKLSGGGSSSKKNTEDSIEWNPPKWEKNPYFWVALTLWLTLAGISLMFQN